MMEGYFIWICVLIFLQCLINLYVSREFTNIDKEIKKLKKSMEGIKEHNEAYECEKCGITYSYSMSADNCCKEI